MTGLMDLNDSDHTVKLIILLIEGAGKSSYANHLCPVISVKAGKESQRKINCTNKKSAFAGMTEEGLFRLFTSSSIVVEEK